MPTVELFTDLMFVAVATKLSEYVKEDLSLSTLGVGAVMFVCFWYAWLDLTWFHTRFVSDDSFSTCVMFVYALGVLGMGLHFGNGLDDVRGFVASIVFSRIALLVMYVKVSDQLINRLTVALTMRG